MAEAQYSAPSPPTPARIGERRAALVHLVAALAEAGVPYELLVDDVRAGVARVAARHGRSGR